MTRSCPSRQHLTLAEFGSSTDQSDIANTYLRSRCHSRSSGHPIRSVRLLPAKRKRSSISNSAVAAGDIEHRLVIPCSTCTIAESRKTLGSPSRGPSRKPDVRSGTHPVLVGNHMQKCGLAAKLFEEYVSAARALADDTEPSDFGARRIPISAA